MPCECSDQTRQEVPGGSDRLNRRRRTLNMNASAAHYVLGLYFSKKKMDAGTLSRQKVRDGSDELNGKTRMLG